CLEPHNRKGCRYDVTRLFRPSRPPVGRRPKGNRYGQARDSKYSHDYLTPSGRSCPTARYPDRSFQFRCLRHTERYVASCLGGSCDGASPSCFARPLGRAVLRSVQAVVARVRPAEPLLCLRPATIAAVARRFVGSFPGDVLYAVKCNPEARVLRALWVGG